MRSDDFEWDDEKARISLRKHKLRFEHAALLFESQDIFEDIAETDDNGEDRWAAYGRVGQRVL